MAKSESDDALPRFAISTRDRDSLLDTYAPADPSRARLRDLIRSIQSALHAGVARLGRAAGAERQSTLDHLKDLERTLGKASRLLSARVEPRRRAVASLIAAEIARSLTDEAFRLAGFPIAEPSSRDWEVARIGPREPAVDVAEQERRQREAVARQSSLALARVLGRCRMLIGAELAVERGNRGGRPSDALRKYVLIRLALDFEEIFGAPPSAGETGTFVKLAADVLVLFGLETHGVESAARRTLVKLRPGDPSRSKPKK